MKKSNLCFLEKERYTLLDYIAVFAIIFVIFAVSMKLNIKGDEAAIKMFMTAALAALGLRAFWLQRQNRLTGASVIGIIVAAGMVMRIGYMLYTHMFVRGHDLGAFETSGDGHLAYILNLMEGKLPPTNEGLHYHPPLFHMLAYVFAKIGGLFYSSDVYKSFEFAQIINCTASCYMIMALRNFVNETELKEKYKAYAVAFTAFFPNLWLMGGRLNNDMIVTLCMLLCVIYTYRWYKNRDMKTIVLLALSFGIGMMTKISCGIMALFTGPVMIYCLVKDFKSKKYKDITAQLAVFALICFPLALWYPIRNYIMFDQPLNYVLNLGDTHFTYTGGIPWYKRFFEISLPMLMKQPFANMGSDYSIPMHVIRTAIAGEFTFEGLEKGMRILIIVNILLCIVIPASMIYVLTKYKKLDKKLRFGFFAIWLIVVIAFIQMNISYPNSCTMDFRYIPLTVIISGFYSSYALQLAEGSDDKYIKYAEKAASAVIVMWCALGCIMYI